MKQRVLVLGAAGLVGQAVVRALSQSGWAVPMAVHHRSRPVQEGVETRVLDATDRAALTHALSGIDAVVNCVGASPAVMIAVTEALVAAAGGCTPPPRLVHLSSMSVYGAAVGTLDETAALRGDTGAYAASKVRAEHIASCYPNLVILRPGCIYGPGSPQWSGRIAALLRGGRIGNLGASGKGYCNLVLVDDVAAAVLQSLKLGGIEGQAFNLAATSQLTWNQYFGLFAAALGDVPPRQVSRFRLLADSFLLAPLLKLAGVAMRAVKAGRQPPPPFPPSLLQLFGRRLEMNALKAERMLALNWTPLSEGLIAAANDQHVRGRS